MRLCRLSTISNRLHVVGYNGTPTLQQLTMGCRLPPGGRRQLSLGNGTWGEKEGLVMDAVCVDLCNMGCEIIQETPSILPVVCW